jgi:hypothetical protein
MASWEQSLRGSPEKAIWFARWELARRNAAAPKNAAACPQIEATAMCMLPTKECRQLKNCKAENRLSTCTMERIVNKPLHKKKGRATNPYDYEYAARQQQHMPSCGGDSPTLFCLPASLPRSLQASIHRDVAREEQRRKECIRQKIVARREVKMRIYCVGLLKSNF